MPSTGGSFSDWCFGPNPLGRVALIHEGRTNPTSADQKLIIGDLIAGGAGGLEYGRCGRTRRDVQKRAAFASPSFFSTFVVLRLAIKFQPDLR